MTKQLESQIATFKEKSAKEGTSAGCLTYEVHYRGDHAKFAEAAKVGLPFLLYDSSWRLVNVSHG